MGAALVAMARPYEFSDREQFMHARCLNWGLVMAGHVTNLDLRAVTPRKVPMDEIDAALVEEVMTGKMRWQKHFHYRLFRYVYLGANGMPAAANYFRKTEWWIRSRHREGLGFLTKHVKTSKVSLQSTK